MPKEEVALVTEDKWMKEPDGLLDQTDKEMLREISQNGRVRVRVINIREMLLTLENTEPKKFRDFKKEIERQAGKRLTIDELVEWARKAHQTLAGFSDIVTSMTLGQAAQVRYWRIQDHMTWRSIAKAAFLDRWFGREWAPSSNQLMGMALAEKAARLFGENFRDDPWN